MFLPHKIQIYRATKTTVRGTTVSTYNVLYSDVPAMVYKKGGGVNEKTIANNAKEDVYNVITQNIDIKFGDKVTIVLTPTYSQTDYIVDSIDYNYSQTGNVDNVYFTIKRNYG